jgi:hypothetical protein
VQEHQAYFVTKFRKFCITEEPEDNAIGRFSKMVETDSNKGDPEQSFSIGYSPDDYETDMVSKMANRMNLQDNCIDRKIMREILPPSLLEDDNPEHISLKPALNWTSTDNPTGEQMRYNAMEPEEAKQDPSNDTVIEHMGDEERNSMS